MPFPSLTISGGGGSRTADQTMALLSALLQMGYENSMKKDLLTQEYGLKGDLMTAEEEAKAGREALSPETLNKESLGGLFAKLRNAAMPLGMTTPDLATQGKMASAEDNSVWQPYYEGYSSVLSDLRAKQDQMLQSGDAKGYQKSKAAISDMEKLLGAVSDRLNKEYQTNVKERLGREEKGANIRKAQAEAGLYETVMPQLRRSQVNLANAQTRKALQTIDNSEEKPTEFSKRLNTLLNKEMSATEALDFAANSLQDTDSDINRLTALMTAVKTENRKGIANRKFDPAMFLIQMISKSPAKDAIFKKLGITPGGGK